MANRTMTGRMFQRSDTEANWKSKNPVLGKGEFGYDETNKVLKIGDGSKRWNDADVVQVEITPETITLATASWAKIAELSQSGTASDYFDIGDEKTITLTTGEQITLVILDFEHDELESGGYAGITFGMKHLLSATYPMNDDNINDGGWDMSKMRTRTMRTLYGQLPSDLKAVIKSVQKHAFAGMTTDITISIDDLFLFAFAEVFGNTIPETDAEGWQYSYFASGGDTQKALSDGAADLASWWLRTAVYGSSDFFIIVDAGGDGNVDYASAPLGVCFGFCI